MKILNAIKKLFTPSGKEPSEKSAKRKIILLAVAIPVAIILITIGVVLFVKRWKRKRLEKEAAESEQAHVSTDPNADLYEDGE